MYSGGRRQVTYYLLCMFKSMCLILPHLCALDFNIIVCINGCVSDFITIICIDGCLLFKVRVNIHVYYIYIYIYILPKSDKCKQLYIKSILSLIVLLGWWIMNQGRIQRNIQGALETYNFDCRVISPILLTMGRSGKMKGVFTL
jgi:hypothetical protein